MAADKITEMADGHSHLHDSAVRVRYAPSPTGHLHIGNARTAIYNYLFARHFSGTFIVRIEDTDLKRNVAGGEDNQFQFMKWLGMTWDEGPDVGGPFGPYRQTERLELYVPYWQKLIDEGRAYRCYCTEEELELERAQQMEQGAMPQYSGKCRALTAEQQQTLAAEGRVPSVRFKVDATREYSFDDLVKGRVTFEAGSSGDFVIVKKDGIPTYNFAVVIDDHLMAITHVLRGEDHISNTPRQLMIYEALGWEPPTFGHMTLIVNEQRRKLSKRDESIVQFIEQYRDLGYLPEALFNFITLLGWSPPGEEELFSRDELIALFTTERLAKSPAVFDPHKLQWMNHEYIKRAEPERIVQLAMPYLQRAQLIPEHIDETQAQWLSVLVGLLQERLTHVAEITTLSRLYFEEELVYDDEAKAVLNEPSAPVVLRGLLTQMEQMNDVSVEAIRAAIKQVQAETGYKGKALFMAIRTALTGQTQGPDLNTTLFLLGRQKILSRLRAIVATD